MNPDSENANQKFQQVSEAYATLGSAANRCVAIRADGDMCSDRLRHHISQKGL